MESLPVSHKLKETIYFELEQLNKLAVETQQLRGTSLSRLPTATERWAQDCGRDELY